MKTVERVARALCLVDGKSPDDMVETGERISRGFLGSVPVMEPRWHRYRAEAERFAAAFEAMRVAGGGATAGEGP